MSLASAAEWVRGAGTKLTGPPVSGDASPTLSSLPGVQSRPPCPPPTRTAARVGTGVSAAWSRARRRRPRSSRDPRVHERAKGGRAEVCFRREAQSWESALGHWPEHPQFRQPGKRAPRGQSDCPPAASDAPSLRLLFPPASSSASAGATRTPAALASASSTFRS